MWAPTWPIDPGRAHMPVRRALCGLYGAQPALRSGVALAVHAVTITDSGRPLVGRSRQAQSPEGRD